MQITLVYGPPRSGKSQYIQENQGPSDVVISFESVMGQVQDPAFWRVIGGHGDEFRRDVVWQLADDFLRHAVRRLHDIVEDRDIWIESPFCREWTRRMFLSRVMHLFPDAEWRLVYCAGDEERAKQAGDPMPDTTLSWLYSIVEQPTEREKSLNIVEVKPQK